MVEPLPWWKEEHKSLAEEVENFVEENRGRAEEALWKNEYPMDLHKKIVEKGWWGVVIPREYGGMGGDYTSVAIISEYISNLGSVGGVFATTLFGGLYQILRFGNEEQKAKSLPKFAKGTVGAVCITEPYVGSDAAGAETIAIKEGDKYIINGKKRFITNAGMADIYVVYAVTDPSSKARKSYSHLSAFILEKGMKGFHVEKINELQGFDGLLNGYLDLDHVEVPVENRLSEEGQGWWILVSGLNFERLVIGAQQVGLLRELARYVAFYTRRRVQFNQPTFEYEANQYKLADIIIDYRITRLLTYYTAYLMDQGVDPVIDANVLKAFSTEAVEKASRDAIQAMGGDGWTKFYPVEAIYRNAKLGTIGGGTSEVLKRFIVRYALTAMADDLKTPIRISHPELKVPITVSEKSITKEKLQGGEEGEMEILRVLARDYLVNPGLFMELNDIKRFIECDEKQLVEIINSLEAKGLVKVLRDRDKPRLVKATYDGLRKAYPREYYMYFPRWVKEKMSEYIF
ncbi:hypothetical protein LD85_1024 [Saccharolobus islandicus L.D.8.5]|uniref:Acyl-CoA dehydrogenase domain protein n=1 Tax=Saccharolobus islandicus (strain L.D.8.5 / Lassen \|nr:hypothetical protein LD85_1024 [Sulfolobus islandicus L.D.8.5]